MVIAGIHQIGKLAFAMANGVLWAVLLTVWLGHTGPARGQEVDCEDTDDLEAVDLGIFRCKADEKAPQSRTSPDTLALPGGGSVYRPAVGKPPVGAREIKRHAPPTGAEKIDSAKHLKRILDVYDARGVWDAKQGTERYTFIPSLAARKNPELRAFEEAEWKKLLAQHNEEKFRQHGIPLPSTGEPLAPSDQPSPAGTEIAGASVPPPTAKDPLISPAEPQGQTGEATPAPPTPAGEPVPGELWQPEALEQAKLGTAKPRVTGGAPPSPGVAQSDNPSNKDPAKGPAASSPAISPASEPTGEQAPAPELPTVASAGTPFPQEDAGQSPPAKPGQSGEPPPSGPPASVGSPPADTSAGEPRSQTASTDSQTTSSGESPAKQQPSDQPASGAPQAGQPSSESPPSSSPPEGAPPASELPPTVLERLWTPEDLDQATADASKEKPASGAPENLDAQEESSPDGGASPSDPASTGESPDVPSDVADSTEEATTTEESRAGGEPAEPPSLLARLWQALESLAGGFWQPDPVDNTEFQGDSPNS